MRVRRAMRRARTWPNAELHALEDIEQAEARLRRGRAGRQLALTRERYTSCTACRAHRRAAVQLGTSRAGRGLVSLLTANRTRASCAASRRPIAGRAQCRLHVQGVDAGFRATMRSVRADPAFTPYYALTGDDASRLAYRAELELDEDAAGLAAGLPLSAECAMTAPVSG